MLWLSYYGVAVAQGKQGHPWGWRYVKVSLCKTVNCRMRRYCKGLWIKALCKWTIYYLNGDVYRNFNDVIDTDFVPHPTESLQQTFLFMFTCSFTVIPCGSWLRIDLGLLPRQVQQSVGQTCSKPFQHTSWEMHYAKNVTLCYLLNLLLLTHRKLKQAPQDWFISQPISHLFLSTLHLL